MENIAKSADYEKLLDTIAILLAETKKKEFELEDPYGEKKTFTIHSMSIQIIAKVEKVYGFNNCAIDRKETNTEKSILICLWIRNKHKISKFVMAYDDITLDIENFKIFFYQNINLWVNDAVRVFFTRPKKYSKYSWKTKDNPEESIKKINFQPEISKSTIDAVKELSTRLHKEIKEVHESTIDLAKEFTIFLMADTDGRKILTQNNEFLCLYTVTSFINKQDYTLQKVAVTYKTTEKELRKEINEMYEKIKKSIKEYEQIYLLETGWYPIFMNTDATHTLFHEGIAGHLLSGKYIIEEDSKVFHELDKDFSADPRFNILKQLTIENKPNLEGTIASYKYDHEGVRAKDIVLMDKGKVINYLTDRNSAYRLGQKESNGTSLASTFVDIRGGQLVVLQPEPRISNLIITSHSEKTQANLREDMIKYCENKA